MEPLLKDKLKRNIWITRKCRINASERLLSHAKYIEILNVYYSIFIILISLFSLSKQDNFLSIFSLACSIVLTISIVYANTIGYRERSVALKQNYINLQLLLDQLSYIESGDSKSILIISDKYAELLKSSENHSQFDMYKFQSTCTDAELSMSKTEKILYYSHFSLIWIWKIGLFILPVATVIFYFVVR
ncbi:SLATT domain-containing protein [Holdemania massiliensis]|uniref:SLATT domain-containing protein n=1 Tax=Holdemania massiliensis TaxID=1468449 RepID=A0A6N7S3V8_9FIRM|nr:SLATT domain-containing protein [Holdemania massiliensis]MSA70660.1 SLATT domain-containing protein [Holdemania massiliensis]MSA88325.1 SLATT domain-containing protein [Holdemania massiliensis]MSB77739.1 SLATT domain-containing protein [Holdemania massiliensis]MSC32664.1 SLATT domain-containing protein [Holdemania massiliensis]MSC38985.1 SLATT domain-containing protein [Holdemania massiliensis]